MHKNPYILNVILNVNSESFAFKMRKEIKRPFIISSISHRAGGLSQAVGQEKWVRDNRPGRDQVILSLFTDRTLCVENPRVYGSITKIEE